MWRAACEGKYAEPQRTWALSIATRQLQGNVLRTRAALLISRTFEHEDGGSSEERQQPATARRGRGTSTMLTFRKRVRSASTVISVFSEWPESLGPPALHRKLHLDSRRTNVSLPRSVCLRLLRSLYIRLSALQRPYLPCNGVWIVSAKRASSDARRRAHAS